jgi:hypothetical protein
MALTNKPAAGGSKPGAQPRKVVAGGGSEAAAAPTSPAPKPAASGQRAKRTGEQLAAQKELDAQALPAPHRPRFATHLPMTTVRPRCRSRSRRPSSCN